MITYLTLASILCPTFSTMAFFKIHIACIPSNIIVVVVIMFDSIYIVAVSLSHTNQVLLVVGVILLSIATIVCIVLIVVDVRTHKGNLVSLHYTLYYILYLPGSRLFLIMLVVGCVVVVPSIVLWVAVGFQVGLQKSEILIL